MTAPAAAPTFVAEGVRAAGRELGHLAALLVAMLGGLGFLGVSDEVTDGHTRIFDEGLMRSLRQAGDVTQPIGPHWLRLAATDLTALGSIAVLALIVLVVTGYFLAQKRWRAALLLLAACASGLALVNVLKVVFGRERPPLAMHAVEVANASFPSGHATLSAIVYLSLATLIGHFAGRGPVRAYALIAGAVVTLMVGASRVYLGVHWPTDVMAGWALGAAWAMLWWLIAWLLERRESGHRRAGVMTSARS